MFQIRGYGKCKGPEVEAYLVYSRKSREASTAETEEARIGEDRKRDRGNSCTGPLGPEDFGFYSG